MTVTKEKHMMYDDDGFSFQEAIMEAKRCLNCKKPLCRTGCPISNNIPEFIHALSEGNIGLASTIIAERSNLPAVCGRVCPHERQCEGACILARKGQGIKVGKLERFIADMDGDYQLTQVKPVPRKAGKIAVVGSGPAGLTVGGDLAKMGFEVTIFDSNRESGGVLMYGIPDFRLSKDVVRREVNRIAQLGVEFRNNVMVGAQITVDDLFNEGYDAIFIGTGNTKSKNLPVKGNDLPGVIQATYFLQMVELANTGDVDNRETLIEADDTVIVVGGGNTAMDAARTAVRQGAKSVSIVYRRREEDMPALKSEIEAARQEGIAIHALHGPLEILGTDRVAGMATCVRRYDEAQEMVEDTEERVDFPATKILLAIGQKPASHIVDSTKDIQVDDNGFVKTRQNPYGMTTRHGVFSGGDVVNGPATVVRAMKDAQQVAKGIAQYVEAKKLMEECGLKWSIK